MKPQLTPSAAASRVPGAKMTPPNSDYYLIDEWRPQKFLNTYEWTLSDIEKQESSDYEHIPTVYIYMEPRVVL